MKLNDIVTTSLGNTLEWFDFGLFIFMAPILGHQFFPSTSTHTETIEALIVFSAGFICRPLGGILLGHLGDTQGRAKTLRISILLITMTTLLVGILPTYSQVGLLAPVIFTLLRFMQGISIGGEYSGVMIYLAESAPAHRRGFFTAFASTGANLGFLLATLAFIILKSFFSLDEIHDWAWRLPFILTALPGTLILYFRFRLHETTVYQKLQHRHRIAATPLLSALTFAPTQLLKIFGLTCLSASFYYIFFGYMITYMHDYAGIPQKTALSIQSLALTSMLVLVPIGGMLGDRFSRKTMLMLTSITSILLVLPCFYLIHTQDLVAIIAAISIATVISSIDQGNTQLAAVENCAMNVRYSGIAFAYNLGNAIFGGTVPLVVTLLTDQAGVIAPAYYLIATGSVTLLTVLTLLPDNRQAVALAAP